MRFTYRVYSSSYVIILWIAGLSPKCMPLILKTLTGVYCIRLACPSVRPFSHHTFMRGSRKNCQRGSKFVYLFIDRGIEDQNTAINGQSSAHQRNAIEMAFYWRSDDGPTLNAGLVAFWFSGDMDQYYKETLYFCDFSGEGSDPPPPLWIRTWVFTTMNIFGTVFAGILKFQLWISLEKCWPIFYCLSYYLFLSYAALFKNNLGILLATHLA